MILSFGKYKGKHIENVVMYDPRYIQWCIAQRLIKPTKEIKKLASDGVEELSYETREYMCTYELN